MFHVILYEPQIPPNSGNAMRLCANTGSTLHLVHPLGFSLDDAQLRRAGLDYRDLATVREHPNLDACLRSLSGARVFAIEDGSGHGPYAEVTDDGKPPLPHERGPKDVVYLGENESVRLLVGFHHGRGRYMMHCHNLVHKDHDMMAQFEILDPAHAADSPFADPCRTGPEDYL